jgi:hypothetical protein
MSNPSMAGTLANWLHWDITGIIKIAGADD